MRAAPESGAIKGIVSERDYLRAVARGRVTPSTKVKEIMVDFERNPDRLVSVTPECSVLAAMEIMTEHRIRHIPCISPASADGERGAKMEGMVTIGDVVKELISEEREEVALCATTYTARTRVARGEGFRGRHRDWCVARGGGVSRFFRDNMSNALDAFQAFWKRRRGGASTVHRRLTGAPFKKCRTLERNDVSLYVP